MSIDGMLTWDDGGVWLAGELLPGLFVDQTIRGAVRFDMSSKDSQSGKAKVPMGFEDADITITLDLLCDEQSDCYAKLQQVSRVFRADRKANPKVYGVGNRHCDARGIRNVIFSGLDSYESNIDDVISVTLSFIEHLPPVIRRERQATAAAATAAKAGTPPAVKATPAAAPEIVTDNAFMAGFNAGNN